jgi:hypothetical protein
LISLDSLVPPVDFNLTESTLHFKGTGPEITLNDNEAKYLVTGGQIKLIDDKAKTTIKKTGAKA